MLNGARITDRPEFSEAGPPRLSVVSAVRSHYWGILFLISPSVLRVFVSERLASKRARRDLAFVAQRSQHFTLMRLQSRLIACIERAGAGWHDADASDALLWLTPWYWHKREREDLRIQAGLGLRRVSQSRKIRVVRPLVFIHRNDSQQAHENSRVVFKVRAHTREYAESLSTGTVMEGSKTWKQSESLWTLTFNKGMWRVSSVEKATRSLDYAMLRRELPPIEDTLMQEASDHLP